MKLLVMIGRLSYQFKLIVNDWVALAIPCTLSCFANSYCSKFEKG